MSTLKISNLHVAIDDKEILRGIDLEIKENEIHALMGPNGNGMSTLLQTIMGHPRYTVTQGSIFLDDKNVLEISVDERSKAGLFLAMQYPLEIPGVTNSDFLRAALNARSETPVSLFKFIKEMEKNIAELQMKPDLAHRFLNEGFSGGEKKRNEILQMRMLKPSLALLDEIDSGLDVDALKVVASAIKSLQEETKMGLVVVSHYERFYDSIKPTHAHVLIDGKIVMSGEQELVAKIDSEGYDWLYKQLDIKPIKEENTRPVISLGTCGAKRGK